MQLVHDVRGVSKLVLILLLLIDFVLGAILSYIWTMGFYAPQEFHLPKQANITIENVEFFAQNASFFDLTVLNPSYSNSSIKITKIAARTTDDNRVHVINVSSPPLPHTLERSASQTFRCNWNWANYTGIKLPYTTAPVEILVFIEDGSGATFQDLRPVVNLLISEVNFNSSLSLTYFNVTVQNLESSATYVNITSISLDVANITRDMVTPSLPFGLAPGDPPATFRVSWNWTDFQGKEVTIGLRTLQGYLASSRRLTLSRPVSLEITDVLFGPSNTSRFSVTVRNNETSPGFVSVNEIFLTMENGTTVKVLDVSPPHVLQPNASASFIGVWDWTHYRNQTVIVTVNTVQGFSVSSSPQITPPPIILEIIAVDFNPINTTSFNVTVVNTPFSLRAANITRITITLQNGTVIEISSVEPSLPRELALYESVVFTCVFEWVNYSGMDATVTAYTVEGFKAAFTVEIPTP